MILLIESGLALAAILLAMVKPELGSNVLAPLEQKFAALAERQRLSVAAVGLIAVLARIAALPILPVPRPWIADEFSHLLLADTLLHGRLANPTHPMWTHFETLHVIMRPTYASMYPPGQGFFLALGRLLTGNAFAGVCLSTALMCAAICWMLQAWVAPPWALLGGLLAVLRLGVFSYWANSYWGGAVAAMGGAFALGALGRILKHPRVRDALLLGLGLLLLANSRPYEGLIFSLPIAVVIALWLFKQHGPALRVALRRVIVPLAGASLIMALGMGYYFWRVTGSPLRMPYQVDRSTYAVTPYFLWQAPAPAPTYRQDALRQFYLHTELDFYARNRSPGSILAMEGMKLIAIWLFYVGPVLTLPLIFTFAATPYGTSWVHLSAEAQFLLLATLLSLAGLAVEVFFFPHYAAPMTALIYGLILAAMQNLRHWEWKSRPMGLFLTRSVAVVCLLTFALRAGATPLHLSIGPDWPPTWYNLKGPDLDRTRVEAALEREHGKQLVIVRYGRKGGSREPNGAWVYNGANIDGSKIVWAWDMGDSSNQQLIHYFSDRKVWRVELDRDTPEATPYPDAASSSTNESVAR